MDSYDQDDPNFDRIPQRNVFHFAISWIFDLLRSFLSLFGVYPRYLIWRAKQLAWSLLNRTSSRQYLKKSDNEDEDDLEFSDMSNGLRANLPMTKRNRMRMRPNEKPEMSIDRRGASYPGMVNLSGTLCYMNSVLQSFASLTYLHRHLEAITSAADRVDVPTGIVDDLADVLCDLNQPSTSSTPPALRPNALINSLSLLPSVRRLLSTREHQDAHELFLLLTSAVGDEEEKVRKEVKGRERGLGWAVDMRKETERSERESSVGGASTNSNTPGPSRMDKAPPRLISPFEGLSANRRTCLECGWCESIRYETMGALDVAVPMSGHISLHNCIRHFTKIETLSATCDSCTLRLTLNYYTSESTRLLSAPTDADPSQPFVVPPSRKKRAREARRIVKRLEEMRDANDLTDMEKRTGLDDVKWVKTASRNTKQSMIARPPPILCLHLVRSEYTNYGQIVKKTPLVAFPSILDMTDFTTTGSLRMTSDGPISGAIDGWDEAKPDSDDPNARPPRVMYRLDALICHYGFTHSFGHFVAYRRIPTASSGPGLARKACPDYCDCEECRSLGQVRWSDTPGCGWLRISDADVEEVGESEVLSERGSAFLLFYERVQECEQAPRQGVSVMEALKQQRQSHTDELDDLI